MKFFSFIPGDTKYRIKVIGKKKYRNIRLENTILNWSVFKTGSILGGVQ
jgi:hypothetical protein